MRCLLTFSTHGFLLTTYYPLLIDHIQLALRFVPLYFRTLYFFFHVRGAPFRTLLRRRAAPRHHSWPRHLLRPRPHPRRRPPRRFSIFLRHILWRTLPHLRRRHRRLHHPGRLRRRLPHRQIRRR